MQVLPYMYVFEPWPFEEAFRVYPRVLSVQYQDIETFVTSSMSIWANSSLHHRYPIIGFVSEPPYDKTNKVACTPILISFHCALNG